MRYSIAQQQALQGNFERWESLRNLTPADVYFGRGETILLERASRRLVNRLPTNGKDQTRHLRTAAFAIPQ